MHHQPPAQSLQAECGMYPSIIWKEKTSHAKCSSCEGKKNSLQITQLYPVNVSQAIPSTEIQQEKMQLIR